MYIAFPADETPASLAAAMYADREEQGDTYRVVRVYGRTDWLLTLTINGVGRYRLNGETVTCEAGDVMLLLPGAAHDYATASGERWNFYWVHYMADPAWQTWLHLPMVMAGLARHTITDGAMLVRLHSIFERMIADNKRHDRLSPLLAYNGLEELLLCIASTVPDDTGRDARITTVLDYMETHLDRPIALEDLAELVSLSPSRLAHLFRETVGHPPMQSLIRLRMRHAARLLAYSTDPIQAIAAQVGYESAFHFSRQFKQTYGISPKAYRKTHNGMPSEGE
jgi:AraC family transcriptional regulator of arabinose operon